MDGWMNAYIACAFCHTFTFDSAFFEWIFIIIKQILLDIFSLSRPVYCIVFLIRFVCSFVVSYSFSFIRTFVFTVYLYTCWMVKMASMPIFKTWMYYINNAKRLSLFALENWILPPIFTMRLAYASFQYRWNNDNNRHSNDCHWAMKLTVLCNQ